MHRLVSISSALALFGLSAPALAQDEPMVFNYDKLLLSTLQPVTEADAVHLDAIMGMLQAQFARNNEMVSMANVPAFDDEGYDAQTYMLSCPDGRYAGCALVVGQRVEADWVIGGTVETVADDFEEGKTQPLLNVTFVDVRGAREVASFGVILDGRNDQGAIEGIAGVYDRVVQGDYEDKDVRGDAEDPEALKALQKQQAEIVAAGLAELEQSLGEVVMEKAEGRLDPPKVTMKDLQQYEGRDDAAPWERVGMSQAEYLRFANRGISLNEWNDLGQGRFGQLLIRLGAGYGGGPYSQAYSGEVLLDSTTLQPSHSVQYLEARNSAGMVGEFELGFGVAPVVDVMFVAGVRGGELTYLRDEDVDGEAVDIPGQESRQGLTTYHFGARANFVPLPRSPVRPTAGLGLTSWKGSGIPEDNRFGALAAPSVTMLELLPGAEITASKSVNIFGRGIVQVPIASKFVAEENVTVGSVTMANPPTPESSAGGGWGVQFGILFRLGPLWKSNEQIGSSIEFEDEGI